MAVLRVQCQAARPLAAAAAQRRAPAPSSSRFAGVSVPRAAPRVRSRPRQVAVAGLFGLGVPELAVIAGVAALIFGPSKLPEIGKGLGKTVKSFQGAAKEFEKELKEASAADEEQPAAPAAKKDEPAAPPKQ